MAKTKARTEAEGGREHAAAVEVRFSPEEIRELDAWIATSASDPATRPDAVRQLVQHALAVHREWDRAKAHAALDEGRRPEELTAENDD
jgi:hypothetical protein